MNVDDGVEDIRRIHPWSRGRQVARGVLRSSPKPGKGLFLAIGEGSGFSRLILFSLGAD